MKKIIRLHERDLRRIISESVRRVLKENRRRLTEDIHVGAGGGYFGGSSIFSVKMSEDGTPVSYNFSPPGWDFDTKSQLEAAAVCASANKQFLELMGNSELTTLPVVTPDENDMREALYWLTGGNAEWYHGFWAESYNVKWDDAVELLMDDYDIIDMLNTAVSNSKSFYDLVLNLKKGEYLPYAAETLSDYAVYDDEGGE